MKKLIFLFFIGFVILTMESCVSANSIRNRIKSRNPDVQAVGIFKEWEGTKYLALDIIFKDGGRLLLTVVNPLLNRNFSIMRVGNYFIFEPRIRDNNFISKERISVETMSTKIDIPLKTVDDVIKNYKTIYSYIIQNESASISKEDWSDYKYRGRKPQY